MNSQVIAIGPFSKEIVPYLGYSSSPELYADTRDGITIAEIIFFCEISNDQCRKLATCFGIDFWDFNQHELNGEKADIAGLGEIFDEEEVERFVGLRRAGFRFFFLPDL